MEYWLHPTVLYGVTAYLPTLCMTSPDKSSKIGPRVITAVRNSDQFHRPMHELGVQIPYPVSLHHIFLSFFFCVPQKIQTSSEE